jgi:RND family efflux transporter MFP subunit
MMLSWKTMNTNADLLSELRIDRNASASPPPSRRGLWIGLLSAAIVAGLAVGGWFLLRGDDRIEVNIATAAPIASASNGAASVLDATGYVVPRRIATVSAKVTGKVREIMIEEGMRVEAGQILATLDPIDADSERALALSQLQASRSQVGNVQAQLKEAEANASRLGQLVGQKLVSRQQYEQSIAARDSLRAQLDTAQRNAQVSADSLRIADNSVDNTVVRAPFAGVIIAKSAQPGEIISPSAAGGGFTRSGIGTIVDMDSLEVEVDVNEAYIGKVQPKMPVEATLNAYPDWKIPAEVIAIIPTADRSKATVKVRIALLQRDGRIVPDMGVRVSFLNQKTAADASTVAAAPKPVGVLVPRDVITQRKIEGKDTDVVFVVVDGKAVVTRVQTGEIRGEQRVVLSGLAPGDSIVSAPSVELQDGAKVFEKAAE